MQRPLIHEAQKHGSTEKDTPNTQLVPSTHAGAEVVKPHALHKGGCRRAGVLGEEVKLRPPPPPPLLLTNHLKRAPHKDAGKRHPLSRTVANWWPGFSAAFAARPSCGPDVRESVNVPTTQEP